MFVTLEGPEGAGKSTVIAYLAERLSEIGRRVMTTREPGSGAFGAQIRRLLLHGEEIDPKSELFLFLADRAQHVAAIIKPALAAGDIVLCDRHTDSTVVYQGYGRGLDIDKLKSWNAFAVDGLKPDLTLLLDLPPEVGLSRAKGRDRLESESLDFHQKVRNGFLSEAQLEPERWIVVDAEQPLAQVREQIWLLCRERLLSCR